MEDIDYTVSYSDNINVGTVNVTIAGKGDYKGTTTCQFKILKAFSKISISKKSYAVNANMTGNVAFKLNAKALGKMKYKTDNSKVKVSSSGKVTIAKGFSGRAAIDITVDATDNYYGDSKVVTIDVKPQSTKFASVKESKKKITLKWKKNVTASSYEVQYATDAKFKKSLKKKKCGKNAVSLSLSKLQSGKMYYIRIRAVKSVKYNGKTVTLYSAWTNTSKCPK